MNMRDAQRAYDMQEHPDYYAEDEDETSPSGTKELDKEFKKRGFVYREISRSNCGGVRMYGQYDGDALRCYVVAVISTSTPSPSWKSEYDLHENFPGPEQHGKKAWTFTKTNKVEAITKMAKLETKETKS